MDNKNECLVRFDAFIDENRAYFESVLHTGQFTWDDDTWTAGIKGVGWLQGIGKIPLNFASISRMQGLDNYTIQDVNFKNFAKSIMVASYRHKGSISPTKAQKLLIILKRWYASLVKITGETHPIYLTTEVLEDAMSLVIDVANLSGKTSNLADDLSRCESLQKYVNHAKFTLAVLCYESNQRFVSNRLLTKKAQKQIAELGDVGRSSLQINDNDKLINICSFLNLIELMERDLSDGERLALNFYMLLIVTGFRCTELCYLRYDSLIRKPIEEKSERQIYINAGLKAEALGIKYFGAKGAGEQIHWVEPLAIPIVEAVFESTLAITKPMREILVDLRLNKFDSFLTTDMHLSFDDYLEMEDLFVLFDNAAMQEGNTSRAKDYITKALKAKGIQKADINFKCKNKYARYYTKTDIEHFIRLAFESEGSLDFAPCTVAWSDNSPVINYEELLFLHYKGSLTCKRSFVFKTVPIPFNVNLVNEFFGSGANHSIFQKYNLFEEDGVTHTKLKTHFPRHNVNTFLALAGVSDHIQAMLMGRRDISQNQYYQHITNEMLIKHLPSVQQLTDFQPGRATPAQLLKHTNVLPCNPNESFEHNLKTALGTHDDKGKITLIKNPANTALLVEQAKREVDDIFAELAMEIDSELATSADTAYMLNKEDLKAYALPLGFCITSINAFECVHSLKCQSGQSCPHFSLTGRMDEYVKMPNQLEYIKHNQIALTDLSLRHDGYEEALLAIQSAENYSESLYNGLQHHFESQVVLGCQNDKTSHLTHFKTLAELFAFEQKKLDNLKIENKE